MTLQIHDLILVRSALGPGLRAGIFVQGCGLGCPGCFNPHTHAAEGGRTATTAEVVEWVRATGADGVTLTGGEPTDQMAAVTRLALALREAGTRSIVMYSGRRMEEICELEHGPELLDLLDVLIDGRYVAGRPEQHLLRGSENQEIYLLTDRHQPEEFARRTTAAVVRPGGLVLLGFGAPGLSRDLRRPVEDVERNSPR